MIVLSKRFRDLDKLSAEAKRKEEELKAAKRRRDQALKSILNKLTSKSKK